MGVVSQGPGWKIHREFSKKQGWNFIPEKNKLLVHQNKSPDLPQGIFVQRRGVSWVQPSQGQGNIASKQVTPTFPGTYG